MNAFYTVLIYPLELLFEVVFALSQRVVGNPGWAIVLLSLAVNFLVLPLYNRADEVQKRERDLEESLNPGISRIKNAFKGDERMMMLQAFYKENNYSPLFVLKGSVSLLLQIPFFMAAYNFLSHLGLLHGASFGPVTDLGSPDGLLPIGSLTVNVLPIIMTLVNIISGYIYTKGMPLKSKIQLYGMALLFLVLLYNSPSGLAFYWTLNNVFSLVKNVFYKLKRPGFVFSAVCAVTGIFLALYINIFYDSDNVSRKIKLTVLCLLMLLPLIISYVSGKFFTGIRSVRFPSYREQDNMVFVFSGVFMTVLTGFLIPSSVIKSSPSEFMNMLSLKNPIVYAVHSTLIAAGFFIVWGGVFYLLAGEKWRAVLSRLWMVMCPSSLISYLLFGTDLGDVNVSLVYVKPFLFTGSQKLINLVLVIMSAAVVLFLYHAAPKISEMLLMTIAVVVAIMSVINIFPITAEYRENQNKTLSSIPHIPLSSSGKNVMVILLDRAPGYLVPYIFEEMPELALKYDGFTAYTNTVSFGKYTKFAAPALYGGYDYTPSAINADQTRSLVEKHDQALTVMPILFRDLGYEVTIMDPPYAGYDEFGDNSVFSAPEYEGINVYDAEGILTDDYYNFGDYQEKIWLRNFFCFSVFKTAPLFIQDTLYNLGRYNNPQDYSFEVEFSLPQVVTDTSVCFGVNENFMFAYEELSKLDDITSVNDDLTGSFMYLHNNTTHDVIMLREPDYEPFQYVDNTQYDADHAHRFDMPVNGYSLDMNNTVSMEHYECNAAAYIQLGNYFDYLRELGVWDNTRIIIVADHGIANSFGDLFGGQLDVNGVNIDAFNPVLMVKDFDSTGFNITDEFMTNADVPYIAVNGIIDDPVNPYTGNPIEMDHSMPILAYDSAFSAAPGDQLQFPPDDWYSFTGTSVLDPDSWEFDGTR